MEEDDEDEPREKKKTKRPRMKRRKAVEVDDDEPQFKPLPCQSPHCMYMAAVQACSFPVDEVLAIHYSLYKYHYSDADRVEKSLRDIAKWRMERKCRMVGSLCMDRPKDLETCLQMFATRPETLQSIPRDCQILRQYIVKTLKQHSKIPLNWRAADEQSYMINAQQVSDMIDLVDTVYFEDSLRKFLGPIHIQVDFKRPRRQGASSIQQLVDVQWKDKVPTLHLYNDCMNHFYSLENTVIKCDSDLESLLLEVQHLLIHLIEYRSTGFTSHGERFLHLASQFMGHPAAFAAEVDVIQFPMIQFPVSPDPSSPPLVVQSPPHPPTSPAMVIQSPSRPPISPPVVSSPPHPHVSPHSVVSPPHPPTAPPTISSPPHPVSSSLVDPRTALPEEKYSAASSPENKHSALAWIHTQLLQGLEQKAPASITTSLCQDTWHQIQKNFFPEQEQLFSASFLRLDWSLVPDDPYDSNTMAVLDLMLDPHRNRLHRVTVHLYLDTFLATTLQQGWISSFLIFLEHLYCHVHLASIHGIHYVDPEILRGDRVQSYPLNYVQMFSAMIGHEHQQTRTLRRHVQFYRSPFCFYHSPPSSSSSSLSLSGSTVLDRVMFKANQGWFELQGSEAQVQSARNQFMDRPRQVKTLASVFQRPSDLWLVPRDFRVLLDRLCSEVARQCWGDLATIERTTMMQSHPATGHFVMLGDKQLHILHQMADMHYFELSLQAFVEPCSIQFLEDKQPSLEPVVLETKKQKQGLVAAMVIQLSRVGLETMYQRHFKQEFSRMQFLVLIWMTSMLQVFVHRWNGLVFQRETMSVFVLVAHRWFGLPGSLTLRLLRQCFRIQALDVPLAPPPTNDTWLTHHTTRLMRRARHNPFILAHGSDDLLQVFQTGNGHPPHEWIPIQLSSPSILWAMISSSSSSRVRFEVNTQQIQKSNPLQWLALVQTLEVHGHLVSVLGSAYVEQQVWAEESAQDLLGMECLTRFGFSFTETEAWNPRIRFQRTSVTHDGRGGPSDPGSVPISLPGGLTEEDLKLDEGMVLASAQQAPTWPSVTEQRLSPPDHVVSASSLPDVPHSAAPPQKPWSPPFSLPP